MTTWPSTPATRAVALGRNPRGGKPTKGHDDTYICDLAGRAIAFTTGEPSALCTTLPGALAALTGALQAGARPGPDTRPLIVFDRGAAFPSIFTEVDAAGYDWLTWRRAPLAATTLLPIAQTITLRGGRVRQVAWTDEQITLKDYAKPVRQLTLFEHGKMAAQAISGRLDACPAELAGWLRGRWAEENMFKYDMANYGLDMLADYAADEVINAKPKANPAYITARKAEAAAKTALTKAETGLAKLLADPTIPAAAKNSMLIPRAQQEITACQQKLEAAGTERKKHRAKLPASEIDPAATRAILHINRRCLQLTLRLLAANAEHYLAGHLNAYLQVWRWGRSCGLGYCRFRARRSDSAFLAPSPGQPRPDRFTRKARRRWPRGKTRRTAPGCLGTAATARRWPRSSRRSWRTRPRSTWRRGSGWCAPGCRGAARTAGGRRCGGWKPPAGR